MQRLHTRGHPLYNHFAKTYHLKQTDSNKHFYYALNDINTVRFIYFYLVPMQYFYNQSSTQFIMPITRHTSPGHACSKSISIQSPRQNILIPSLHKNHRS